MPSRSCAARAPGSSWAVRGGRCPSDGAKCCGSRSSTASPLPKPRWVGEGLQKHRISKAQAIAATKALTDPPMEPQRCL
eukprot:1810724-Pyramimonas_sp.AAC.1